MPKAAKAASLAAKVEKLRSVINGFYHPTADDDDFLVRLDDVCFLAATHDAEMAKLRQQLEELQRTYEPSSCDVCGRSVPIGCLRNVYLSYAGDTSVCCRCSWPDDPSMWCDAPEPGGHLMEEQPNGG